MKSIKIPKGASVNFTPDELKKYQSVAQEKIDWKLGKKLSISNYGFRGTSLEKETMAIMAEVAFAKMAGIPIPTDRELINSAYYDFLIFEKTVDVKATKSRFPSISIPLEKAFKQHAEYFALVRHINDLLYQFIGACHKNELIKVENISQPPGFDNKIYSTINLTDLELTCDNTAQELI